MTASGRRSPPSERVLPKPEPGFENVGRRWDPQHKLVSARIQPGEYYITRSEELLVTVLGSCVAACIRDKKSAIGGMNHFMLPTGDKNGHWAGTKVNAATRYGNFAMEHLMNDLISLGAYRNNLEIKLFGGGNITGGRVQVGAKNVEFVTEYLRAEGYDVSGSDLGGVVSRKLMFFPASGRVLVKHLSNLETSSLLASEQDYKSTLEAEDEGGEIDLF